jgi:hypothetical protein
VRLFEGIPRAGSNGGMEGEVIASAAASYVCPVDDAAHDRTLTPRTVTGADRMLSAAPPPGFAATA